MFVGRLSGGVYLGPVGADTAAGTGSGSGGEAGSDTGTGGAAALAEAGAGVGVGVGSTDTRLIFDGYLMLVMVIKIGRCFTYLPL